MCRRRPALEGLARTVPAAPHRCRHWEPPAGVSSARWSAACEAGHHLALCEAAPLVARRWAQCSSAAARHEAPRHAGAGASAATGPLSASRWPGPRPAALRGQPGGSSRWPLRVQTAPQTKEEKAGRHRIPVCKEQKAGVFLQHTNNFCYNAHDLPDHLAQAGRVDARTAASLIR